MADAPRLSPGAARRDALLMLLWLAVAFAALAGLAHALHWGDVQVALRAAAPGWLLISFGAIVATQWLKAVRWALLLRAQGIRPPFPSVLKGILVGQGLNTFLPLRMGEVARIQGLKQYDRVLVLSTITLEKSADLLCFALMCVALALGTVLPPWLDERFRLFAVTTILAIALAALLLLLSRKPWLERVTHALPVLRPLVTAYLRFRAGWRRAAQPGDAAALFLLSTVIWGLAVGTNVALLAAFGASADWVSSTVLLVVLQIGITIVTLPATIGIFEYLCVITLGWFGISEPVAFGIGVTLHLLVLIPSVTGVWLARPRRGMPHT